MLCILETVCICLQFILWFKWKMETKQDRIIHKFNWLMNKLAIYIFVIKGSWTLIQIVLVQFNNSRIVKRMYVCTSEYTPSCPPQHVCTSMCVSPHVAVWVSVLWCSQPAGAINQQRGQHCETEGDFTAPCDWSLSLPASFQSFSFFHIHPLHHGWALLCHHFPAYL